MGFDAQMLFSWGIQLINTGVLVFLLSKILYEPVTKFLDSRTKRIQDTINNAENSFAEASKMKSLYEEKLKGIETERVNILEEANKRAKEMESSIIAVAKTEASNIKSRAMNDIELEKEKAFNDMRAQIIDISSIIAEKYIVQNIDEATQNKLLDEVISDLGDATWLN